MGQQVCDPALVGRQLLHILCHMRLLLLCALCPFLAVSFGTGADTHALLLGHLAQRI